MVPKISGKYIFTVEIFKLLVLSDPCIQDIQFTITYDKEKQQILTIHKLELINVCSVFANVSKITSKNFKICQLILSTPNILELQWYQTSSSCCRAGSLESAPVRHLSHNIYFVNKEQMNILIFNISDSDIYVYLTQESNLLTVSGIFIFKIRKALQCC